MVVAFVGDVGDQTFFTVLDPLGLIGASGESTGTPLDFSFLKCENIEISKLILSKQNEPETD